MRHHQISTVAGKSARSNISGRNAAKVFGHGFPYRDFAIVEVTDRFGHLLLEVSVPGDDSVGTYTIPSNSALGKQLRRKKYNRVFNPTAKKAVGKELTTPASKKPSMQMRQLVAALRRGQRMRESALRHAPAADLGMVIEGKFRPYTELELKEKGLDRSFSLESAA